MREELVRIFKHFKLTATLNILNVFSVISAALMGVVGLFSASPLENFLFNLLVGMTVGFLVWGFFYSCKRYFLENSSVQLRNTRKLNDFSATQLFELLLQDKCIHEEVLRFFEKDERAELENSRYASVRYKHFLAWFNKNLFEVKEASASPDFKGEVRESFFEKQRTYFRELEKLCSDDPEMLANVHKGESYVNEYLSGNMENNA